MKKSQVNGIVKIACLALYAAGIASVAGLLPEGYSMIAKIAALILAVHVVETIVMFKHVKRYQGPLAVSILLSLLFGLAHWMPLAKKQS